MPEDPSPEEIALVMAIRAERAADIEVENAKKLYDAAFAKASRAASECALAMSKAQDSLAKRLKKLEENLP